MEVVRALSAAGCVDPEGEADELIRAGQERERPIEELLARRAEGEPLAWIVGHVTFLGVRVEVDPGVFVPRPHTELLARRAIELLPAGGLAVDLCTGSGAVAAAILSARRGVTVHATDLDPAAVWCARRNGVPAVLGDLEEPLPRSLHGRVDVVTAVVPYVPTDELPLLPRDVVTYEPSLALNGGPGGTAVLARAASGAERLLRPGGHVLLELGGDQAEELRPTLVSLGIAAVRVLRDTDGRDRAIEGRRLPR